MQVQSTDTLGHADSDYPLDVMFVTIPGWKLCDWSHSSSSVAAEQTSLTAAYTYAWLRCIRSQQQYCVYFL